MPTRALPLGSESSVTYVIHPLSLRPQPDGTSKAMPTSGLTTTFHPATVGCWSSPARGLSVESVPEGEGEAEEAVGSGSARWSLPPPRTRNPVTPAATTTAQAATIATTLDRRPPPPPPGAGGGGPTMGAVRCAGGCCPAYGLGCW